MERCDHCGLPLTGSHAISGEDDAAHYCCHGCRMVAEVMGAEADAPADDPEQQGLLLRLIIGGLLAGFVMVLSLAISTEYGFFALQQLEHKVGTAHWVLLLAAVPALVLLGGPVLRSAAADLRGRKLTLNVLFALGTSAAVAVSIASYVRGTGPIYLETAAMLVALYTLGRYLTARARGKTTRVLSRLLDIPDTTYERLAPDGISVESVPGEALAVGDRVCIRAGDVLPVDGRVEKGRSFVDASRLTGEARPAAKQPGDPVYAGTSNLDGTLTVCVTAVAEARRLAQVEQAIRAALERPPRIVSLTNRIMRWLIPGVVVLALATFGGWYVLAGFEKALYASLSVVLITCPCALGVAIPLTLVVAHGEATRQGILIRSGRALLDLGSVRAVLFDKTGTLSAMDERAARVVVPERTVTIADSALKSSSWAEEDVLRYAAAVEAGTQHVLAEAVWGEARRRGLSVPRADHVRTIPGAGVMGELDDEGQRRRVSVGNEALLDAQDIRRPSQLRERAEAEHARGHTVLYASVDSEVAGLIVLEEVPIATAQSAIAELRDLNVSLHLLTGDRDEAARRMAAQLGVSAEGNLSPSEKIDAVRRLRDAHGPVAMVGDGINDAAALADADVGIALASGAGVSIEAADITLYHLDLHNVAWLKRIGHRTRRIVHQNLGWTFAYNGVGLGLAVLGLLHPLVAVGVMAVSSGLVTWNAFRVKRLPPGVRTERNLPQLN